MFRLVVRFSAASTSTRAGSHAGGVHVSSKDNFSERAKRCSDWHLHTQNALSSLLDLLLWIPRSCQPCGGRNYEFPFPYDLFSTRSRLPCLTDLVRMLRYGVEIWMLAWNELTQPSLYFAKVCPVNIADCRLLRVWLFTALFSHCLVQQGQSRDARHAAVVQVIFTVTQREKRGQAQRLAVHRGEREV